MRIISVSIACFSIAAGTLGCDTRSGILPDDMQTSTVESKLPDSRCGEAAAEKRWAWSSLNVRSAPSMSGSIVHSLGRGDSVSVVSTFSSWSQVCLDHRVVGFISADLLKAEPPMQVAGSWEVESEEDLF